jgi:cytochrome c553
MSKNTFLVTTVTLLGCLLGASVSLASETAPVKAGDPASGEAQSAVCSGCHGVDGNSPAPSFPKLAGLGEKYMTKQLYDIQSGARVVVEMTGLLDGKSDQDLKDMAAYFTSKTMQLSGAKPQEVKVNAGIKVDGLALGTRVFRAGNQTTGVPACSGCHSPRGLGNEPAGYPRLSGQYSEYIAKQLRAFRAGERTNDGDSMIMRKVAEQMSDAEIDAVANYIAGLN